VILLWAVVILLAFAFFGLLREFRMTQRRAGSAPRPATTWPEQWARPDAEAALVLVIDGSCRLCAEAVDTLVVESAKHPNLPVSVLADIEQTANRYEHLEMPVAVDRATYGRVYPGWAPAVAVFRRGELEVVKPAGSSKAIQAVVAEASAHTKESAL
jgi:hypothetical protein